MKKRPPTFDECLYHSPCADGVSAAWVVQVYTKTMKFTPLAAGRDPIYTEFPREQRLVYVDLCPTEVHLLRLLDHGNHVLIIDHHTSAIASISKYKDAKNLELYLKTQNSGCGLAWEYFVASVQLYPYNVIPKLLKHIEDRDLWTFNVPQSKEIMCAFFTMYPSCSLEDMHDAILSCDESSADWVIMGTLMLKRREQQIEKIVLRAINCTMKFTELKVKCVECTRDFTSDVGDVLAKSCGLAVLWCYVKEKNEWGISLRGSKESTLDLSELAMKFGGGGHSKAAGFTLEGNVTDKNKDIPHHLNELFIPIK